MARSTGRVLLGNNNMKQKSWWPSFVNVWQHVCLYGHMYAVLLRHCITVQ